MPWKSRLEMKEVETAARTLGLDVATSEIRRAEEIAPAFEVLKGRVAPLSGWLSSHGGPRRGGRLSLVHGHMLRQSTGGQDTSSLPVWTHYIAEPSRVVRV
jgi:hypothetical protein